MAVVLQKFRNRFKRKAPLPYYAQSFADLTSATLVLVNTYNKFWSEELAEEDLPQVIDSLNVAILRANAARLQMENIRPPVSALSGLHTDVIWVTRGYDAIVKQTMFDLEKEARGETTGAGLLRRSMEAALRGHQERMIRHLSSLNQQYPALAEVLPVSRQYRLEVLQEDEL